MKNLVIFLLFLLLLPGFFVGCAQDPIADAGDDQTVVLGETATLSGDDSRKKTGDRLTYLWSIKSAPTGSAATLSDTTAASPTFTPDKVGTYVFELIVFNPWKSDPERVSLVCEKSPVVITDVTAIDLTAEEVSRSETHVSFSTTITLINKGKTVANISVPISGKDALGAEIFTKTNSYTINPDETIQITTNYTDEILSAIYDNIVEWSTGKIESL